MKQYNIWTYNIPEMVLLMADQRRLLGRLTTRRGMICPVDGAARGRMMSVSLRGHEGRGVSTPCRSDRPGGGVTTDRLKVIRKGYNTFGRIGGRATGNSAADRRFWCFGKGYPVRDQFAVWRATTDDGRNFFDAISQCALIFSHRFIEFVFYSFAKFSHTGVVENWETITIGRYI